MCIRDSPRLGGNKRKGVFASRAPFRPNPLGLSCVRLEKAVPNSPEGPILYVSGADLLDGTPIYDIKPYLSFADAHPDALGSFSTKALEHRLNVHCEDALLHLCLLYTSSHTPYQSWNQDNYINLHSHQ